MGKYENKRPGKEYIQMICGLYGDIYDDRNEDSRFGGKDWVPGRKAKHLSLSAFQKELKDKGIYLSTAKIRKILISGGCWSTEQSREAARLYRQYGSVTKVAEKMDVSAPMATMYLPYEKGVYDLEEKSSDAKRMERYRSYAKNVPNNGEDKGHDQPQRGYDGKRK